MSLGVTIDTGTITARLQQAGPLIDRELRQTVEFSAIDFEGAVIGYTPVGATGHLRGSITHQVSGAGLGIEGRVFSQDVPIKVASVEHGSRPHFPPIAPLRMWAAAKLGDPDAAYAIARAISIRGTRAYGMFNKGYQQALPRVNARVDAMLATIGRVL